MFIPHYVSCVMCHVSCVTCHVSPVTCHLSPITCHLSLTPTATATDPPPTNSPLCTVGWFTKTKNPKKMQSYKIIDTGENKIILFNGRSLLAICPLTRGLQSTTDGHHRFSENPPLTFVVFQFVCGKLKDELL